MNEENNPESKIGGIEALVMVGVAALFDIADFLATFLDALFGAGELVKFFIILTFWLVYRPDYLRVRFPGGIVANKCGFAQGLVPLGGL